MINKIGLTLFITSFLSIISAATISGFVTRKDSAEPMEYVNVLVNEIQAGTQSNKKGYYVIEIPKTGNYTLKASTISYLVVTHSFEVKSTDDKIQFNIPMEKSSVEMAKVVVTGKREEDEINSPTIHVGTIKQTTEDILNTISVAEADVFRAVMTLPGVTPISDFSSGLYVRGGSPDQNLILLDDIDVYNPNHFGGVFSTFNADAVDKVELMKGGFPAEFGGRMSSVLDVTNRQGNRNYHQGVARLSLISSSATLEGPWSVGDEKGSYMGSFRRTYLDLLEKVLDLPKYYFYDGHAKLNWDITNYDKVSTSVYLGKDNLEMDVGAKIHLDWGNKTATSQWVHIFNPTLFSQFILAGSQFQSHFIQSSDNGETFRRINGIDDITLKNISNWKVNNSNQVDFGFELKWNKTYLKQTSDYQYDPNSLPNVVVKAATTSAFIQDAWDIDSDWTFQPGLRFNWYKTLSISLPSPPDASYLDVEPRLSIRRKLGISSNIYASFGQYHQYLTLISQGESTPFDVWMPLDGSLKPGLSNHYILGYKKELSIFFGMDLELYYKTYQNLLEFNPATDFTWNNQTGQLKDTFFTGKGYTWGSDLMLRNEWNGLKGFASYTFSKTRRKMNGTNINPVTLEPEYFYPKYDRTHTINIVENFNISENTGWQLWGADFKVGCNFSYATGQPSEIPEKVFFDGQQYQILYSYKDRIRLPAYARFDISTKYEWQKKWGSIEPYIEVINVFNRKNVSYRNYYIVPNENTGYILKSSDSKQFPLVPFIGVNITW
jgi:hypothetical protein